VVNMQYVKNVIAFQVITARNAKGLCQYASKTLAMVLKDHNWPYAVDLCKVSIVK